jgi:predicted glycoside hydrolase/deacetylase ChbG (UPF0249 family)
MKHLIVNADDFGAAKGTVEAISRLYESGVVTSTTALVNLPDWSRGADYLRRNPKLGAGVHLVMNDGRPVLPPGEIPSLVDREGRFYDGTPLLLRFGRLNLKQLEAEWRAQIEKFIRDSGRQPDHLDLHCHYPYVFPSWFRVSLKLAREYGGLPVRLPFDDALDAKSASLSKQTGFPAPYVRWMGRRYRRMTRNFGIRGTNYWESSFSLGVPDDHRTPEYLLALLENLPEGSTELLCHPGVGIDWRERDYEALMDPRIKQTIKHLDIKLTTYRELFLL